MTSETDQLIPVFLRMLVPPYPRPTKVRLERARRATRFLDKLEPWIGCLLVAILFISVWAWISRRPISLIIAAFVSIWISWLLIENYFWRLKERLATFYANRYPLEQEQTWNEHDQAFKALVDATADHWRSKLLSSRLLYKEGGSSEWNETVRYWNSGPRDFPADFLGVQFQSDEGNIFVEYNTTLYEDSGFTVIHQGTVHLPDGNILSNCHIWMGPSPNEGTWVQIPSLNYWLTLEPGVAKIHFWSINIRTPNIRVVSEENDIQKIHFDR